MSIKAQLIKARQKTRGEEKAPWWSRWIWWVIAAGLLVLAFALWWMAKSREANMKAQLRVAGEIATKENLKALSEKNAEKAAQHRARAIVAKDKIAKLTEELAKTEKERRKVEALIKGATTWEELDAIEKELK